MCDEDWIGCVTQQRKRPEFVSLRVRWTENDTPRAIVVRVFGFTAPQNGPRLREQRRRRAGERNKWNVGRNARCCVSVLRQRRWSACTGHNEEREGGDFVRLQEGAAESRKGPKKREREREGKEQTETHTVTTGSGCVRFAVHSLFLSVCGVVSLGSVVSRDLVLRYECACCLARAAAVARATLVERPDAAQQAETRLARRGGARFTSCPPSCPQPRRGARPTRRRRRPAACAAPPWPRAPCASSPRCAGAPS